jgi:hypothetical protein
MMLDREPDWLPLHGVLDGSTLPSGPLIGAVEAAPVPFVRPFTLESVWLCLNRFGIPGGFGV